MKNKYLLPFLSGLLLVLVGLTLQSTVFSIWPLFGVRPDLVSVQVILLGMRRGSGAGGAFGALGGIVFDLYTGRMIGLNLLSKTMVGLVAGVARNRVFVNNFVMPVLLVFTGSILDQTVVALVIRAFGEGIPLAQGLTEVILPVAVYNSLLAVVIRPIIDAVDRALTVWVQA